MSNASQLSSKTSELEQGDIIWFDFNPSVGHEQANYRPAVVISKREFNKYGLAIVLPVTTTPGPMKVEINCLPDKSYVMCDQPRTIDLIARRYKFDKDCYLVKSELEQVLGRLKPVIF